MQIRFFVKIKIVHILFCVKAKEVFLKLFIILLSAVCVVCAANFAGSGEIQGNKENIKNIAIWQTTNKRRAIFDAGGFLVGDSLKSSGICSLMQEVNYSAIAVGDEELRFSAAFWKDVNKKFALPLVATNIKTNSPIFEKIRVVEYKNGEKYAIISVLGNENFDNISGDYEIEDPRKAISAAISRIPQDYMIVLLAHCDPALTDSLINEFPRISYGVQGHKKISSEPVVLSGGKQVLQFWFGGGRIAILNKKGVVRWRFFTQKTTDKSGIISIDIFTMSGCQYSKNAIADFLPLMKNKNYSINIRFAGNYDSLSHKLSPGQPNGSIEEEKIWLAMQNLYPEKFQDFLFLALKQSSDSKKIAQTFGLDSVKFAKWNVEKGDKIITENYKKSQLLNISECPTILVDNKIINLSSRNIIRNLCELTKDTVCFGLGQEEIVKITFIASKYETPNLPVDYVLQSTPAGFIDTIFLEDSAAKDLLEKFNIERIPAIIIEERDAFVLDWGEIPDGEYYRRDFHENELVVIADGNGTEEIRPFLKENAENWHLLTDDEIGGQFLIWWENRCLTTANDLNEAKTLINYYKKIKGGL